jgi:hypothetical protein
LPGEANPHAAEGSRWFTVVTLRHRDERGENAVGRVAFAEAQAGFGIVLQ